MKTRKRTEITIETERVVVISRRQSVQAWCQACGRQVVMVTVDEAARFAYVSARTIYRWVEDEKLHFTETSDGGLLICHESLSARQYRSVDDTCTDKLINPLIV